MSPPSRRLRLIVIIAILFVLPSTETRLKAQPQNDGVTTTSRPAKIKDDLRVKAWWQVMGWGMLLLVIAITCSAAIIIFSRRFRKYLTRGVSTPTLSDDVWAMHKLPEEPGDESETQEDFD